MPIRRGWLAGGLVGLLALAVVLAVTMMDGEPAETVGTEDEPAARSGADGAPGVSWTDGIVVDSGPGFVGPWRMNRSDWRYVDDPSVALDSAGRVSVVWVDQGRKDVLFQRYGPEGEPLLESVVNVSRSPEVFSWLPKITISEDGEHVYLLWQEIIFSGGTHGGEAFFARSSDGGRTFTDPVHLSRTPAGAGKGRMSPDRWHNGSLDLALGPQGELVAVWTVYEGGLFASRSADGGTSFSDPIRVTAGGRHEPARAPSVNIGPEGTVHLAWAVGEDAAADLRYSAASAGTTSRPLDFGEPRIVFESGGHADAPKVAADRSGDLHLTWMESPPGVVGEYRIRYARASGSSRGFETYREVAALDREHSSFGFPSLTLVDGVGPALLWELYGEGADHPRGLVLAVSGDSGRTFSRIGIVPGTGDRRYTLNGSLQGRLMKKLAANADRRIAVVNSGFEPGEASRILLVRGELAR